MENTTDVMKNVLTRRHILNNQLDLLKNRISGRDNSFLPFICTKDGKITKLKLTKTINELVSGPKKYEDCYFGIFFHDTPTDREIYSCFFFCAMLGIAIYDESEKCVLRGAEYFSDITDLASHENNLFLAFNPALLHKLEVDAYFNDVNEGESRYYTEYSGGGFFRNCDVAYYILTGEHITDTLPKDERDKLFDNYFQKEAELQGFSSYDEYAEAMENSISEMEQSSSEPVDDEDKNYPEDETCEMFDESEIIAKQKEKNEEWRKSCPFPEEFAQNYLRFRELFFKQYDFFRKEFFENVQLMVDIFLYTHGLSCYLDEDAFAFADNKLDGLISIFAHNEGGRS